MDKDQFAIDSRQYIFAYRISSPDEIPGDFPALNEHFQTGLFLPRDDPDWFGRSAYPPYVLLLCPGTLLIVAHPTSRQPVRAIRLNEMLFVEVGHILLQGWLRLLGVTSETSVRFNTRSRHVIESFLHSLRDAHLGGPKPLSSVEALPFGEPLSLKFQNALTDELKTDEHVLLRLFSPAVKSRRRYGIFWCNTWTPGDLLVLTDRRVLWISDNLEDRHEFYGTVVRWARLDRIRVLSCLSSKPAVEIVCAFAAQKEWRIAIPPELGAEARHFVEEASADLAKAGCAVRRDLRS